MAAQTVCICCCISSCSAKVLKQRHGPWSTSLFIMSLFSWQHLAVDREYLFQFDIFYWQLLPGYCPPAWIFMAPALNLAAVWVNTQCCTLSSELYIMQWLVYSLVIKGATQSTNLWNFRKKVHGSWYIYLLWIVTLWLRIFKWCFPRIWLHNCTIFRMFSQTKHGSWPLLVEFPRHPPASLMCLDVRVQLNLPTVTFLHPHIT